MKGTALDDILRLKGQSEYICRSINVVEVPLFTVHALRQQCLSRPLLERMNCTSRTWQPQSCLRKEDRRRIVMDANEVSVNCSMRWKGMRFADPGVPYSW